MEETASSVSSLLLHEVDLDHDRERILSMDCQGGIIAVLYTSGEVLVKNVEENPEITMSDTNRRRMLHSPFRFSKWIKNPHKIFLHPSGQHLIVTTTNGFVNFFTVEEPTLCCSIELASDELRHRTFVGESLCWITPLHEVDTVQKSASGGVNPFLVVLLGVAKMGLCFQVSFEFLSRSIKPSCALLILLSEGKNSTAIRSVFYTCFSKHRTLIIATSAELYHVSVPVEENEDVLSFLEDLRQKNYRMNRIIAPRNDSCLEKPVNDLLSTIKPSNNPQSSGMFSTFTPVWGCSDPRSFCWSNNEGIVHGLFQRNESGEFNCKLEQINGSSQDGLSSSWGSDAVKCVVPTASYLLVLLQARLIVVPHTAGVPWCRVSAEHESPADKNGEKGSFFPSLQEVLSTSILDSATDRSFSSASIQDIIYNLSLHRVFVRSIDKILEVTLHDDLHRQWNLYIRSAVDPSEIDILRQRFFTAATKAASTAEERNTSCFLNGFYAISKGRENIGIEMLAKCEWFGDIFCRLKSDLALSRSFLQNRFARISSQYEKYSSASLLEHLRQLGYIIIWWAIIQQATGSAEEVRNFVDVMYTICPSLFSDSSFSDNVAGMLLSPEHSENFVYFHKKTKKFGALLSYLVENHQLHAAVETLAVCDLKDEKFVELWQSYLPKLITAAPVKLLGALRRFIAKAHRSQKQLDLDPFLPAFLKYTIEDNEVPNQMHQVKLLLNSSIYKYDNESAVMHNYYLFLLAEEGDLEKLKIHLEHSQIYDAIFGVQVCLKFPHSNYMPLLYKRLGFYSDIAKNELNALFSGSLSRTNIDTKMLDEFQIKFIWKNTLQNQLNSHGPKEALKVVDNSKGILTLHDLLQLVKDDSVAVESLKDPICHQLDKYSSMCLSHSALYANTLQAISISKYQLHEVQQQVSCISSTQKCYLCGTALLGQSSGYDPYLVYPSCGHAVHENCAVKKLRGIGLNAFLSTTLANSCSSLEAIAARDCVICGEAAILEVAISLV